MPVSKHEVEATLAVHDPEALLAILEAADVSPRGAITADALAHRITDALWWNYSTPMGYVSGTITFDQIVDFVTQRLQMQATVPDGNPWWRLEQLTAALALGCLEKAGVALDDLDPKSRERIVPRWWPTAALGTSATGSLGARWGSGKLLAFLKGPIGRLLPLIPPIAPYYHAIRTATAAVNIVAGPLAVGLAVLTLNESLGTNERRLVPLLLGVGALGPDPIEEAFEVSGGQWSNTTEEATQGVAHTGDAAPDLTVVQGGTTEDVE